VSRLFVPGRLCLFGEHSDWAASYRRTHPDVERGYCLVAGTEQGLSASAAPLDGFLEVTSVLPGEDQIGPARIEATSASLAAAARGSDFFSYAAGTALVLHERYGTGGLRLEITTDLPVRKGLSSSAAVCVLVARAYDRVYGLGLDVAQEMELAYEGERRTGSECGRMDQVCAHGQRVTFLCFDADGLELEVVEPEQEIQLLVVDLRRGKDTRRILADLNACFPDAQGPLAARVRHALGPRNAELLKRARGLVAAGAARALGELMNEAQALFDECVAPASAELRAPRLHELLDHPAVAELAWGGKGVGSQGDGCAQLVAHGPDEQQRLARILERELGVQCLPLALRPGDLPGGR